MKKLKVISRLAILGIFMFLTAFKANAYVECPVTPSAAYVDSSGIYITWYTGGAGAAAHSDVAAKYYYSTALTAIATGKALKVRYPDGTSCAVQGGPIIGLWII